MAKIKLTKGELKKQRDSLKQFRHYLPTLLLKKQQLQMKILEIRKKLEFHKTEFVQLENKIKQWVSLLGDTAVDILEWITPVSLSVETTNIAGAKVLVFEKLQFKQPDYDFYTTPFWIDVGIEQLRKSMIALAEIKIIKEQIRTLEYELRITTQRVNLFEKVKIPECLENIRRIGIYLGDVQANAVGISKVAKKKIEIRNMQEMLV